MQMLCATPWACCSIRILPAGRHVPASVGCTQCKWLRDRVQSCPSFQSTLFDRKNFLCSLLGQFVLPLRRLLQFQVPTKTSHDHWGRAATRPPSHLLNDTSGIILRVFSWSSAHVTCRWAADVSATRYCCTPRYLWGGIFIGLRVECTSLRPCTHARRVVRSYPGVQR